MLSIQQRYAALVGMLGVMAAAGAWAGCSSSSSGGATSDDAGGVDAGKDVRTGVDTGTVPLDDASDDVVLGPPTLDCTYYCAAMHAHCFGIEYNDDKQCQTICATFPPGALTDTTGNTLGCRIYHAGLALGPSDVPTHCPHAGAYGGGVCGDECENFCALALSQCSAGTLADGGLDAAIAPFTDQADCVTKCKAWPTDGGLMATGPVQPATNSNSIQCRELHVLLGRASCESAGNDPAGSCLNP